MTTGAHDPSPEATAAAVAPLVDRIRMSMMNRALAAGFPESAQAAGLDPNTAMMLAYLRNAWLDRVVNRSSVKAVFTYQPDKPVDDLLDALVALGLADEPGPALLRLTPLGQRVVGDLHLSSSEGADALWAEATPHVQTAGQLVGAVLEAARETGGASFLLMAPTTFPPGTSAAGQLAEQLTGLRFHRFDAHIAAWRSAGYTVADLEELAEDAKAAIEADTNQRAGVPFSALGPAERALLIESLDALPY